MNIGDIGWAFTEDVWVTLTAFDPEDGTTTVLVTRRGTHTATTPERTAFTATFTGDGDVILNGETKAWPERHVAALCSLADAVTMGPLTMTGVSIVTRAE